MGSYVNTAAANDTVALLLKKIDQVVASNVDIIAKYNALQASYAAVIAQLNLETTLTQGPYVDGTAAAAAAPVTAASELM
jgi:hypothetical protein